MNPNTLKNLLIRNSKQKLAQFRRLRGSISTTVNLITANDNDNDETLRK